VKNAPLLSPRDPSSHVNFSTSFSRPFLAFTEQKAQKESGKCSLPTKKELSSRHLCLQPTNHTPRIPQATLYFAARQVGRARGNTRNNGFNLQCNNVARQVEGKCCPFYRTFNHFLSSHVWATCDENDLMFMRMNIQVTYTSNCSNTLFATEAKVKFGLLHPWAGIRSLSGLSDSKLSRCCGWHDCKPLRSNSTHLMPTLCKLIQIN